ncbi:hypothetical protein P3T76_007320 [Phytophthora citrophthora]|uniref:Uncharacterized protein n=1 Tax=Phytophthora citrophthora TaxID=4793 RepID=A0AAD9LNU0_9STRA|nr:hypothetical protein P3T76_007320 [Phytophthora citrophthora]
MEAQNREFESKIEVAVEGCIEDHFQRRQTEMAPLISVQIRAELRKGLYNQEKRIQVCVADASRAANLHIDGELADLKKGQCNQDSGCKHVPSMLFVRLNCALKQNL